MASRSGSVRRPYLEGGDVTGNQSVAPPFAVFERWAPRTTTSQPQKAEMRVRKISRYPAAVVPTLRNPRSVGQPALLSLIQLPPGGMPLLPRFLCTGRDRLIHCQVSGVEVKGETISTKPHPPSLDIRLARDAGGRRNRRWAANGPGAADRAPHCRNRSLHQNVPARESIH